MQHKIVVITGSTSGIGLGIAEKFASLGAKLVINGIATNEVVAQVSDMLKAKGAGDVFYHPADLSKQDEIADLFNKVFTRFHRVDVLVNNAGIQFVSPIDEFPAEKWEAIIRINLIAAFYTIKSVLPKMKENRFGRIINIASAHALVASPFKSAYVAAKHGLLGLTRTVALEVAEAGITINAICPGYVETPLVLQQIAATAKARGMSEEDVITKVMLGLQATKKFVNTAEIAELVALLCSDKVPSVTGAALSIDGGWTSQ